MMSCENKSSKAPCEWKSTQELLKSARLLRASTSSANSDTFVYEREGRRFLLKTYLRHGLFARLFFGRVAIAAEAKMLRRLQELGFHEAPRLFAQPDAYTLIQEYIDGEPLLSQRHYTRETMPRREFFREMADFLHRLHAAGIAHGDFRRANMLIDKTGHLRVIDWATSIYLPPEKFCWRPGKRGLHKMLLHSDDYSLASIVESYYPGLLPAKVLASARPNWFLRATRFLRYHLWRHGLKRWLHLGKHAQK